MSRVGRTSLVCALLSAVVAPALLAQSASDYARASEGTRQLTLGNGTVIKMLLDASNLGSGDLEVAEITFQPGPSPTRGHRHTSTEIFYVVEGVLGHVVNGEEFPLSPGMVGVVKPTDKIIHRVLSDGPVKAVVIWAPGGEGDRIAPADRWSPIAR